MITPVLQGWWNVYLINVRQVREFIEAFKPDFVHIFSFAIHTEFDKKSFQLAVQPRLEEALGVKIQTVPIVDEIFERCARVMGLGKEFVTFQDASDFWSKHESFRLYQRDLWKGLRNWPHASVDVALLDDAVLNESFEWPTLKIKGRLINVDLL